MSDRSVVATARKVPCPTCHAPRFEYCIGPSGAPTERSHPARVAAARQAPSITPAQVEAHRRGRRPKQRLLLTDAGREAIGVVVEAEAKAS